MTHKCSGIRKIWRVSELTVTRASDERRRTGVRQAVSAFCLTLGLLGAPAGAAPYAYVTISGTNSVAVIDTADQFGGGSADCGRQQPHRHRRPPAGTRVYVTNRNDGTVSVIDTATNAVVGAPITVGSQPNGIAINPAGTRVYVANFADDTVSVIDTATNGVVGAPIAVGSQPDFIAVNPAGTRVYVANTCSDTVSVIDTATNTVVGSADRGGLHWSHLASPSTRPAPACTWRTIGDKLSR